MFKIAKEFSFEMAHMIDGHDGKCQNLHGHSYKLQIVVAGDLIQSGAKKDMVMDYSDLKKIVKDEIITKLDHAFMFDATNARESKLAKTLQEMQLKTYALNTRTTAEAIAKHIYHTLKQVGLKVDKVKIWETGSSYCEYYE